MDFPFLRGVSIFPTKKGHPSNNVFRLRHSLLFEVIHLIIHLSESKIESAPRTKFFINFVQSKIKPMGYFMQRKIFKDHLDFTALVSVPALIVIGLFFSLLKAKEEKELFF